MLKRSLLVARRAATSRVQVRAAGGVRGPPHGGYTGLEAIIRGKWFKEDHQLSYFLLGVWGVIIYAGKIFLGPLLGAKPATSSPAVASSDAIPSFESNPDEFASWIEIEGNVEKLIASMDGAKVEAAHH